MLFSRRLENITHQYPDAVEWVLEGVKAHTTILDSEAVALDPETGQLLPFQQLMRRRRKYRVAEMAAEFPVFVYVFDLLYLEGVDFTPRPLPERWKTLVDTVHPSHGLQPTPGKVVNRVDELNEFFQEALDAGCEGLVCKSLKPNSVYQAGSRGWNWIKYKREYVSEMTDTVDLVVVGALYGRGKRAVPMGRCCSLSTIQRPTASHSDQVRHRLHRPGSCGTAPATGALSAGPPAPTGGRPHEAGCLVHSRPSDRGAGGGDHPEPDPHHRLGGSRSGERSGHPISALYRAVSHR